MATRLRRDIKPIAAAADVPQSPVSERSEISAMLRAWRVGTSFVMGHGIFMLCLGMALCFVASLMANPRVDAMGYIVAATLTAACLMGEVLIACFGMLASGAWLGRRLHIFLLAGTLSFACWLAFWLSQPDPLNIRLLVLLAGLHGLFWGAWHARLAFHLRAYPRKAGVLCVLAGMTSAAGIILATQTALTDITAVTAVACYTTWIGIQILLIAPYLFRSWDYQTAAKNGDWPLAEG